jgi:hypothetical protein
MDRSAGDTVPRAGQVDETSERRGHGDFGAPLNSRRRNNDLASIVRTPSDTASIPATAAQIHWALRLHLGAHSVYLLDEGPFEMG